MTADIRVNQDRLWQSHMDLADFTDPEIPYTRRVFTPTYAKGRDWLIEQFRNAGLEVEIDAGGNLVGTLPGQARPDKAIIVGSHSDTVRAGGRFDGISGVLAGLEIVRTMKETGYRPNHSIQVWDFLGEEPNEFGLSCVGSRALSGELSAEMLQRTEPGSDLPLGDAIRSVGGDPDALGGMLKQGCDPIAAFELHIEQGRVLEHSESDVGIVTEIVGIKRLDMRVEGRADHAGATPMSLRQDALAAAAELIGTINRIATRIASSDDTYLVATVGELSLKPNAPNVVPAEVRFTVDLRSNRPAAMDAFIGILDKAIGHANAEHKVSTTLDVMIDTPPTHCDGDLQDLIATGASRTGTSSLFMASGAGHDMAFVSRICPVAMVLVPCLDGRSHTPEEYATQAQLGQGADVLLQAIVSLDQAKGSLSRAGEAAPVS